MLPRSLRPSLIFVLCALAQFACVAQNKGGEATGEATQTNTALPTSTRTTTPTAIPTLTATPFPPFHGNWNIRVITVDEAKRVYEGSGDFYVEDQTISGTFSLYPDLYYLFSGDLDLSGQTASGEWTLQGGGSGIFMWRIDPNDMNRFAGNLDEGDFSFCGARPGVSLPSPCMWP